MPSIILSIGKKKKKKKKKTEQSRGERVIYKTQ